MSDSISLNAERQRILVAVAWPYANYRLHVGQLAGAYLPGDIFAQYQRLAGREVLMVSGSDCHGTPITVTAEQEGITPLDVVNRYHPLILEVWERMGISFDHYTTTLTENHYAVVTDVFLRLLEQGLLYRGWQDQFFDPVAEKFLPDRYVEGTCPHCRFGEARGDQCDGCGRTLDALELISPRSRLSGATPVVRPSEHFFLRLTAFQGPLAEWVDQQAHWRKNVLNFTRGWLKGGLKDRAITRDISWGVPVPVEGFDEKRIYVWFDAVIGYLSASKEWAASQGRPEAWKDFWQDSSTRAYYFIGKDNIPFHTIIWPAMLLGHGGLELPFDVPANQYVNFSKGQKQSKSKGTGTWVLDLVERFQPDVIRFYLTWIMPESSDSEFSEEELVRTNNDVLIGTWGNLVNRTLSMVRRHFDGVIPAVDARSTESDAILERARAAFETIGARYDSCQFRAALLDTLELAQAANRYLDQREPWKAVKTDLAHVAETLATTLTVIRSLSLLLNPIIPLSTGQLLRDLDGEEREAWTWCFEPVAAGTHVGATWRPFSKLEAPEPLVVEPVEPTTPSAEGQ